MLQLFLRARAAKYFRARSASRDAETDLVRIKSVFRSIENALQGAKAEQAGLALRVNIALARASVTQGNNSDEYLTREPENNHFQNLLGLEIVNGERRLSELRNTIAHFQFLKTALVSRFPDFQLVSPPTQRARE